MKGVIMEELNDICKKIEELMAREIQETLERACKVNVDYLCSQDAFTCLVETNFYNASICAGCNIPSTFLRNVSQDEFREVCVDYAGTIATALEDSIRRYGNEGGLKC
jgi:hypothetical protein